MTVYNFKIFLPKTVRIFPHKVDEDRIVVLDEIVKANEMFQDFSNDLSEFIYDKLALERQYDGMTSKEIGLVLERLLHFNNEEADEFEFHVFK